MLFTLFVILGVIIGVCLIASAITATSRLLTGSETLSLTLGTLVIPALILASLAYWVMTMEVDDAPPGMVIIGNLTAVAIITPITLLASRLTVKFLKRRARRGRS